MTHRAAGSAIDSNRLIGHFETFAATSAIVLGAAVLVGALAFHRANVANLATGFELTALMGAALLLTDRAAAVERALVFAGLALGPAALRMAGSNTQTHVLLAEALPVAVAAALCARRAVREPDQGNGRRLLFGLALAFAPLASASHLSTISGDGWTCDPAVFNFDQKLGLRVPGLATWLTSSWPPLSALVQLGYASTPALMAWVDLLTGLPRKRMSSIATFIVSAAVAAACYPFTPVAGTSFLDRSYIHSVFSTDRLFAEGQAVLLGAGPRSAMPSLHATWGLFLLWRVAEIPSFPGRAAIVVAGLLQFAGALTVGEHWTLDLVVSVPFAFALHAAFSANRRDFVPAAISAGVVVAWLSALRHFSFADLTPSAAWLLLVTTAASPWIARAACRFIARLRSQRGSRAAETALRV